MLKANKMRIYLFVSVVIFLLCSSVNMIPARVFLDEVKRYSKRQGSLGPDDEFCLDLKIECHGFVCFKRDERDPEHKCLGKIINY